MRELRALLFDLGNVLVHYDAAKRVAGVGRVVGLSEIEVMRLATEDRWHELYESGRIGTSEFAGRFVAAATRPCNEQAVMAAFTDVFSLIDPMQGVLTKAKARGLKLVLVSNTNPVDIATVRRRWTFLEQFDALVLSHEIGAVKPEVAFYDAAATASALPRATCLFVDDLRANIEGACKAGFQGIVFTGFEAFIDEARALGVAL